MKALFSTIAILALAACGEADLISGGSAGGGSSQVDGCHADHAHPGGNPDC